MKTYVVSGIGVVINTTEESCRSILADHLRDQVATTRVLVHEVRNIVNETGNDNKRTLGGLLLDYREC